MSMNKRGGDKIISVYWFVILFIVAAAIVYMVASFYGKPYDVRTIEVNALTNRVADCVSEGGYIKEEFLSTGQVSDVLSKCNLNFNVEDSYNWKAEGQFYTEFEVIDFNSKTKISEFSVGNANLKDFCEMKGENFPVCLRRSFYSIDKNNVQYQVNILSVVRKIEKNVKQ
jgi:hypothetical protein